MGSGTGLRPSSWIGDDDDDEKLVYFGNVLKETKVE